MAFSSGTYSLPAGNPVVTATTITSTWANTTLDDIATALSTCVLKDGTQTCTASVPFVLGIAVTTGITTPSTTFALVNTTATTVNFAGAATTMAIGAAASATTWTGQSLTLTGANGTNNTTLTVTNTSNTAFTNEHSILSISVGGATTAGRPQLRLTVPGGTSWYMAPDGTTIYIGTGTTVGSSLALSLTTAAATLPGTLAVNGANITTDDATFAVFNTNATTINAFGAATVVNIGAATAVTTLGGSITTSAPTGGAGAWELGIANAVSPTSPNRTLTVEIGGTAYYIHAKTTND